MEKVRKDGGESPEALVLGEIYPSLLKSQIGLVRNGSPRVLNSEPYDLVVRSRRCIDSKLVIDMVQRHKDQAALAGELAFFRDEWDDRNRIMAEHITSIAARYVGRRLVVLAGGDHRYILRDLVSTRPTITLSEFWESDNVQTYSPRNDSPGQ